MIEQVFCVIFTIFSVLNRKACTLNLDFETNILFKSVANLSEIYNFKIDNHSQFYKANWQFLGSHFLFNYSSWQLSIDNYLSCECSD